MLACDQSQKKKKEFLFLFKFFTAIVEIPLLIQKTRSLNRGRYTRGRVYTKE